MTSPTFAFLDNGGEQQQTWFQSITYIFYSYKRFTFVYRYAQDILRTNIVILYSASEREKCTKQSGVTTKTNQ